MSERIRGATISQDEVLRRRGKGKVGRTGHPHASDESEGSVVTVPYAGQYLEADKIRFD